MFNKTKEDILAKYTVEEVQGFYKRLHPPTPPITKQQAETARDNYAFYKMFQKIEELNFLVKVSNGEVKPREKLNLFTEDWINKQRGIWEKSIAKIKEDLVESNAQENKKFSHKMVSDYSLRYYWAALSEPHGGDCICLPTGCDRCHAEAFFDIPYTANWSKKEGYEMLEAVSALEMWNIGECIEDVLENPENFNLDNLEN